jgi:hypothetical protein
VGALPRPELPPGPRRELNDALHDLHHQAGWPSLRTLAAAAGCSHTTVDRPHRAAYCRRKAAQAALRDGQATAAARLLTRARRDARTHAPLTAAVEETAGYARKREQRASPK